MLAMLLSALPFPVARGAGLPAKTSHLCDREHSRLLLQIIYNIDEGLRLEEENYDVLNLTLRHVLTQLFKVDSIDSRFVRYST